MDLGSSVKYSGDVLARTVEEEGVLVDLASGTYFGLDEVGNRIWELVGKRGLVSQILDAIVDEYDVERAVAERDLLTLLGQLEAKGLIQVS